MEGDGVEASKTESGGYGALLRAGREGRGLTTADVARTTKIPESIVRAIEAEALEGLPPELYVRGFIRAMARTVGIPEAPPIDQHRKAMQALLMTAVPPLELVDPPRPDEGSGMSRRRIGIAVFVLILVLVATITWRLLLRPSTPGEGLSDLGAKPVGTSFAPTL